LSRFALFIHIPLSKPILKPA